MKKRFVICLDSSTKDQNDLFKEFIREKQLGWWHWLSNMWLLVDDDGKLSASDIRAKVREMYPRVHCLVLELRGDDDTWAGFGPSGNEKNMFKWLKNNW